MFHLYADDFQICISSLGPVHELTQYVQCCLPYISPLNIKKASQNLTCPNIPP